MKMRIKRKLNFWVYAFLHCIFKTMRYYLKEKFLLLFLFSNVFENRIEMTRSQPLTGKVPIKEVAELQFKPMPLLQILCSSYTRASIFTSNIKISISRRSHWYEMFFLSWCVCKRLLFWSGFLWLLVKLNIFMSICILQV